MLKTIRTISTLAVAVALFAVPATAVAAKGGQGLLTCLHLVHSGVFLSGLIALLAASAA